MEHRSTNEILATPFRRLADMTDPEEAIESLSRMLLTSPGGTSLVVNGTNYSVRRVTATAFHETGYWVNAAGQKIQGGAYGPEGHTTYHPHLLLTAGKAILTNIPEEHVLPRRQVRGLWYAGQSTVERLMEDLPDIAAELFQRYIDARTAKTERQDRAHRTIDAIAARADAKTGTPALGE